MEILREAQFLRATKGQRFCLVRRPVSAPLGSVLFVPPFAEEVNKSRRMIALAAENLARAGWCVMYLDLYGTGDSSGDFGDAGWLDWLDDLDLAHSWLSRNVSGPFVLWSLRAGCLVASDWLQRSEVKLDGWLIWQPVLSGKQHLTQFLRLKAAGEMLADAEAAAVMRDTRSALGMGESVEVAGYMLSAQLAQGLESATFQVPEECAEYTALIEVQAREGVGPSPAISMWCQSQSAAMAALKVISVAGSGFWQTQEIELVPALLDKTDEVMRWMVR